MASLPEALRCAFQNAMASLLEEGGKMYTINADGYRTDDGTDIPVTLTSNDATMDPPQETDENTDSVSSSSAAAPAEAQ